MSNNQYGKRIEKKVATKTRLISHDVKRGILWAGTELVKNSQTAGRDVQRAGKWVRRDVVQGGKRVRTATHQSVTRARDRLKPRRSRRGQEDVMESLATRSVLHPVQGCPVHRAEHVSATGGGGPASKRRRQSGRGADDPSFISWRIQLTRVIPRVPSPPNSLRARGGQGPLPVDRYALRLGDSINFVRRVPIPPPVDHAGRTPLLHAPVGRVPAVGTILDIQGTAAVQLLAHGAPGDP